MGAKPSKDELLYQQVKCGNVKGIEALLRDGNGAGLEWINEKGRTPLIYACMWPKLLQVVQVLINSGANVNARSRGAYAGTPLHHAAYNDFVEAVELLLAHGAKPLLDSNKQTPLDLAREKKYYRVVRVIESRICLFAGWLRELQRKRNLEGIVQQCLYSKIWAVILPCDLRNHAEHPKYELAIYFDQQAAWPKPVIPLWKVQIEEPAFNQPDPALVIVDKATKKQYTFLSENEGDKQQLQLFLNACRGKPLPNTDFVTTSAFTPMPSSSQLNPHASATSAGAALPASEDVQHHGTRPLSEPTTDPCNGWAGAEIRPSVPLSRPHANQPDIPIGSTSAQQAPPSAPPMVDETFNAGSIRYSSIDSSPVDLPIPTREFQRRTNVANEGGSTGSCVICLDAPREYACDPCGHKAACKRCSEEIKAKRECPCCRKKIDKVIQIFDP